MGKSSPSAPAAPDPAAVAAAQASANTDAARASAAMNRVDQYTPFGSLTYTNVGAAEVQRRLDALYDNGNYRGNYGNDAYGKPIQETWLGDVERQRIMADMGSDADRWESRVNLDPRAQSMIDSLYGTLGQQFSLSGVGGLAPTVQAGGAGIGPTIGQYDVPDANIGYGAESRARVEQSMMDRLNPSLTQQRDALDTRLRNQGLTPGSEAWSTAMREQAMVDTDARLGVVAQGGQEETTQANIANALFGQKMQGAQFNLGRDSALFDQQMAGAQFGLQRDTAAFGQADQARQRQIEAMLMERQIPLNEIMALMGGVQGGGGGGAGQVQVQPADYTSAVGMNQAAQNQAWQGKVATNSANNQAAAGAAAAAISAAAIIA